MAGNGVEIKAIDFNCEWAMKRESWLSADGVFETLRTYENLPFALHLHLERLNEGLKESGIDGVSIAKVEEEIGIELAKNPKSSGHLRIVITRAGDLELNYKEYQPPIKSLKCLTMQASISRGVRYKSTDYQERFDLRDQAALRGFDDAILVSSEGSIVETTTCNLIFLMKEGWITPPLSSGCLPGITRRLLIENFGIVERQVDLSELPSARAIAVTSSLREIQSVEEVDGKIFPNSRETEVLSAQFHSWILGNLAL